MDILNPKSLRQQARLSLRRGREPKKLICSYAGISLAISAAIYLANWWLDNQISGTGGLGNLGTRAIFSTIQQTIPLLSSFALACLDLGFLGGLMRISRGQYADHTDLKAGFHKLWPLVRLSMIQSMIYFAMLSLLILWAWPLMEVLVPILESDSVGIGAEMVMELFIQMIPLLVVMGIALLLVMYKMRMAYFCLLDDPNGRALAAIRESSRMMHGRFGQMLKIDLSLWIYYAAMVLVWVVLYTDLIMAMLGIPFPLGAEVFPALVYFGSAIIQFAVHVWIRPTAEMTYLAAYDSLREKPQDSGVVLGNIFDM